MLLMDGAKYEAWVPSNEEALAETVKEHSKDIFGDDSVYLDIRRRVQGNSVVAIPDAYCITFNPDQWWVVEVELSSHPVYEHIVNQLGRFINGASDHRTQRDLATSFFDYMDANPILKAGISQRVGPELYRFLSQLVAQPPQYVVLIDNKVSQLDAAVQALAVRPRIVEFVTFCREGVGYTVHIHRFEPLFKPGEPPSPSPPAGDKKKKYIGVRLLDLVSVGLLKHGQRLSAKYKGTALEGKLLASGDIELSDGTVHKSLSGAAGHLTNSSIDGWEWWHTEFDGKEVPLDELRKMYDSIPR